MFKLCLGASFFQQNAWIGLLVQFTPLGSRHSNNNALRSILFTVCISAKVKSPCPFSWSYRYSSLIYALKGGRLWFRYANYFFFLAFDGSKPLFTALARSENPSFLPFLIFSFIVDTLATTICTRHLLFYKMTLIVGPSSHSTGQVFHLLTLL